jgi:DNA-binding PadR family transcriptional regulator
VVTTPEFYILLALRDRQSHGYEILKAVQAGSLGKIRMGPATLYTTLRRLLDAGHIVEVDGPAHEDARRRYYRLSARGGRALDQELARMEDVLRLARRRPAAAQS